MDVGLFDLVDLVCGFVNVVGCCGIFFFFLKCGVGGCGFVPMVAVAAVVVGGRCYGNGGYVVIVVDDDKEELIYYFNV